jgi:hypothetical protein
MLTIEGFDGILFVLASWCIQSEPALTRMVRLLELLTDVLGTVEVGGITADLYRKIVVYPVSYPTHLAFEKPDGIIRVLNMNKDPGNLSRLKLFLSN